VVEELEAQKVEIEAKLEKAKQDEECPSSRYNCTPLETPK
jgi:hypothetical protein